MTGQKSKRQRYGICISALAARLLKEAVNKTLVKYIDKRKATVAEWIALRMILDIFGKETVYEGGGRRREP